jgi:hypothetical protein
MIEVCQECKKRAEALARKAAQLKLIGVDLLNLGPTLLEHDECQGNILWNGNDIVTYVTEKKDGGPFQTYWGESFQVEDYLPGKKKYSQEVQNPPARATKDIVKSITLVNDGKKGIDGFSKATEGAIQSIVDRGIPFEHIKVMKTPLSKHNFESVTIIYLEPSPQSPYR